MGSQRHGQGVSDITVTLLVENHLGAKVIALNRLKQAFLQTSGEGLLSQTVIGLLLYPEP